MNTSSQTKTQRPIYVIDGLNIFIRNFMVNETMNSKSEPIGGVVGFIKFLDFINTSYCPGQIFVVWEAGGGSPRRKALYPEYKANRAKIKDFKRLKTGATNIKDLLKLDEGNKVAQLALLYRVLNTTPICQIFVKDTEGDDVVAYLIKDKFSSLYPDTEKVIVSSDKDFYQLLDDPTVKIYDPAKKIFLVAKDVAERYEISARNFCLAKAIVGDDSDNIEGIPGVGFKTAAKRFTKFLDASVDLTIDDILVECQQKITSKVKQKVYADVLSGESVIRRNWKLMYLNTSTLAASQIEKINYIVDNHEPKMDKLGLVKTFVANGINMVMDFDRFASNLGQNLLYS